MSDCYVDLFLDDDEVKKIEEAGLGGEIKEIEGKKAVQVFMTKKDKKKLSKGFKEIKFVDENTCVLPSEGSKKLLDIILEMKSLDVMKFAITKLYNPLAGRGISGRGGH